MKITIKKTAITVAIILVGILVLLPTAKFSAFAEERYQELQLFAKVLNLVQQYYVEEVDTKKLIYGGIKGMLRELDPHTNFLPPDIYKEFESETSGEFGGIGIEITVQNGILTVISPIEDTPAWKAGIKAGDKIVDIDGESTKGFSLAEAATRMKGKKGSKIKMGIFREGFDRPKDFVIERGVVKIKSVKYTDLDEGYAYIRLTSFIENSYNDMVKALEAHKKKYKVIRGLVLDLRRNPGGLLDQATQISDLYLDEGTIVTTMGRNKREKEVVYAKRAGTLENFPLILLIDEYSASASEILAGALQDNKRALIMGHKSFGKGSVQSVVKLGDGSGLKLTVGRYYTPSGRSIQAEGIVPDIELEDFSAEVLSQARNHHEIRREKDMQGHLVNSGDDDDEQDATNTFKPNSASKKAKKNTKKIQYWWTESEGKSDKELTAKDKLLKDDFQAQQAYNYLKAWFQIEDHRKPVVADATPAPANPGEDAKHKEDVTQPDEKAAPQAKKVKAKKRPVDKVIELKKPEEKKTEGSPGNPVEKKPDEKSPEKK
jgi:carboxyl-terminal processing protease